ncbi:MAG TPA: NAD(P)/FAD-dependent oxidoreductase [Solirubrobacterales bacterium]|nr:NAD(P)/FAD-dependent oxidoreductase [Solirubrobacterales bacterium]
MGITANVTERMGRVGLPAPMAELAGRDWDAVVVGGGHNGLTAAAYLARAGLSVLVLERREVLGGACTAERPFGDDRYVVSPCAYVAGLLDPLVIRELDLERRGFRVTLADPNLWCPFPDGTSFAEFLDDDRTAAHMRANGFAEADVEGLLAYEDFFDRIRLRLRHGPAGDTWHHPSPSREELERLLGDDEMIAVVFEESIAETIDRYVGDERLRHALWGQGVIGTFAGPHTPGTSGIKLMHGQGDLLGQGPNWGYVEGGMGRVSFALAEAAIEAGALVAAGVPVAEILPGEGVRVESGELVRARTILCNADPKRALAMLDPAVVPEGFRARIESWQTRSPVVKVNAALSRMPTFEAAGEVEAHRAMITVTPGLDAGQEAFDAVQRGEPRIAFAELYFQSAYDRSVVPEGGETMSAFCQYAPYEPAEGDWDSRRAEIGAMVLDQIAAYAPDVHECVREVEVLGPPDVEARIGLTGGQIFQGDALPDQMWDRRLDYRTPVEGLYLCGAATHPGGSVIALNGRNAALAALADAKHPAASAAGA